MDQTLRAKEDDEDTTPITPGEILAEEFLAGFGLTRAKLARAIGVSPNRIAEIVNNRRRISAETALRLGLFFNTSAEFWQNLQAHYDLKMMRRGSSRGAWPNASSGRRRRGERWVIGC